MADILEFKLRKEKRPSQKKDLEDPIFKRFGVTLYEYLGIEHKENRPKEVVRSLIERQLLKETMLIRSQLIIEEKEKDYFDEFKVNIFERVDGRTRYKLMNYFKKDNIVEINKRL